MANLYSFNGSNVDFGSMVSMNDWLEKKQSEALRPFTEKINELVANETNITRFKQTTDLFLKDAESKLKFSKTNGLAVGGFAKLNNFAGGSYGQAISAGLDMVSGLIKNRPEYSGKYGGITKSADAAYDTTMKIVSKIPGWGLAAGLIMGAGKLANKAVGRLGGGTDGMTKTDALLGSNFLGLTPLGLINGFGGKKADTYTRNLELDTATNGGYQGFLTTQDLTQIGAGKKYGAFSSGARHKQNQLTEFTQNMKHTVSGVVDTNTINNLAAQGSTPFIAQQQSIDLSGGVQLMRAARLGMKLTPKYGLGSFFRKLFPSQKAKDKLWHSVIDPGANYGYHKPIKLNDKWNQNYEPDNSDKVVILDENGNWIENPNYKAWDSSVTLKYMKQKGVELLTDKGYIVDSDSYERYVNSPIHDENGNIVDKYGSIETKIKPFDILDPLSGKRYEITKGDASSYELGDLYESIYNKSAPENISNYRRKRLQGTRISELPLDKPISQTSNYNLNDFNYNNSPDYSKLWLTEKSNFPKYLDRLDKEFALNNDFTKSWNDYLNNVENGDYKDFLIARANYFPKNMELSKNNIRDRLSAEVNNFIKTGLFWTLDLIEDYVKNYYTKWKLVKKQGGQLNYKRVVSKYQMGNKLKRSTKVLDVADHTYVDIPLNLTLDLIKGREPIRLPGNKIVFMNGDGTVTSDRWETLGEREHLTPRGLNGMKMSYNDWYNGLRKKGVANINYDYKRAYETLPYEELIAHYNNPNKNHLHSVALLPNGDYIFLKLGKHGSEVDKELAAYSNGKTGLEDTHDLKFNEFENRYYYIRKKGPNAKQGEFSKNGNIVSEFKKGGQMNVIPEGALHARLNHLDLISEDLSKITPKGIPVITKEEGGEVVLHAEIEHSEIIFTLDVTNKIEDLRKKWHEDKKDEYAIEAGKILVKEILHNTDDRTNLIKSIE